MQSRTEINECVTKYVPYAMCIPKWKFASFTWFHTYERMIWCLFYKAYEYRYVIIPYSILVENLKYLSKLLNEKASSSQQCITYQQNMRWHSFLDFHIFYHPDSKCLTWKMSHFFSHAQKRDSFARDSTVMRFLIRELFSQNLTCNFDVTLLCTLSNASRW